MAPWRDRWGLVAGVTTRGGDDTSPWDMGFAGTAPIGQVLPRWHALVASCAPAKAIVAARQVHGREVRWHPAGEDDGVRLLEGVDGHATAVPRLLLGVTVADCVPVYLADPVQRLIALLHAGWRGTAAGILDAGIALLVSHGARVADLVMHAGVGICGACYEVGPEVLATFGIASAGRPGHLDLRSELARRARAAGIRAPTVSPWCAAHDRHLFFSHRASGGAGGRMVAYLGLLS
ncbi:MAG TPA: polyphenol oxidase family protein [Gemmatimonadales bacterium]